MAERVKEDLLNNHHADLVAGPDSYLSLPDLIAATIVLCPTPEAASAAGM